MCTLAPLLLLVVTLPLQAQEPATDSAVSTTQGYAPTAPTADAPQVSARTSMDRSAVVSVTVLPLRSETQLREALSNSDTDLRRSEARLSRLSQVRSRADAVRPQHRGELREIEAKIRQADKEKRKADKAALEGEKKALEQRQKWADRIGEIGDAELATAQAACLAALAKQQALDLELQVAQKRAELAGSARGATVADNGSRVVIRQLERQTLEAQKKQRQLEHQLAETQEDLADKRLDFYRSSL
jgi:chromosome segregation ATPase